MILGNPNFSLFIKVGSMILSKSFMRYWSYSAIALTLFSCSSSSDPKSLFPHDKRVKVAIKLAARKKLWSTYKAHNLSVNTDAAQ